MVERELPIRCDRSAYGSPVFNISVISAFNYQPRCCHQSGVIEQIVESFPSCRFLMFCVGGVKGGSHPKIDCCGEKVPSVSIAFIRRMKLVTLLSERLPQDFASSPYAVRVYYRRCDYVEAFALYS